MRAAVYKGEGKPWALENLPDPEPGPGELLLKVHRCGICGTDLSMTKGTQWDFPAGTIPGHEYAGEIVAVGSNVSSFRVGDRITSIPSSGCGRLGCLACQEGNLTLCRESPGVMGGYGEYICIPQNSALKLPGTLSMRDGALIEPLAVGLYGVRQATIQPGAKVLVMGGGSVALAAIYWARRLGAGKIVAISRSQRRRDMALEFGADAFVQYGDTEIEDVIDKLGGSPEIVYECVGAEHLLHKALSHVRLFGQVISMGFCTTPDAIIPAIAAFKAATLKFPVAYTMQDFEHVANVMDSGHVDPKIMLSSEISLEQLPDKIEELRGPNNDTKATVVFQQ